MTNLLSYSNKTFLFFVVPPMNKPWLIWTPDDLQWTDDEWTYWTYWTFTELLLNLLDLLNLLNLLNLLKLFILMMKTSFHNDFHTKNISRKFEQNLMNQNLYLWKCVFSDQKMALIGPKWRACQGKNEQTCDQTNQY